MAKPVIRNIGRKLKARGNAVEEFLADLEHMRKIADAYRKPDGNKLTKAEKRNYFVTGKLPEKSNRRRGYTVR